MIIASIEDKIHKYFGEKVALYFSFLGIYTVSLIPPALIGLLYFFWSGYSMYSEATFAIFNLIWSTMFLEGWKRYCSTLCFKWGSMDTTSKFSAMWVDLVVLKERKGVLIKWYLSILEEFEAWMQQMKTMNRHKFKYPCHTIWNKLCGN